MQNDSLRVAVDDIQQTIKQTFDDKTISKAQIAYWVTIVANQLLGQHIQKRDSGQFISVYIVPVLIDAVNAGANKIKDRKYIELPKLIFDFDKDGGVEFIAYYIDGDIPGDFTRKTMDRTTQAQSMWLSESPYTKPSPQNCYWYRSGNERIYFEGIPNVPIKEVEIGIRATVDPLKDIDLDAEFLFPQELLHVLKRQVLDLARYSFLFPGTDRDNSGDDETTDNNKQIPKIVSVNDNQQQ